MPRVSRETFVGREVPVAVPAPGAFARDEAQVAARGLTPHALEILEAIADGLGNRERAVRPFVRANTVKTHVRRILVTPRP